MTWTTNSREQYEARPTVGELAASLHFAGLQAVAIGTRSPDDRVEQLNVLREDCNGGDRSLALDEAGDALWGYSGPRRESTP